MNYQIPNRHCCEYTCEEPITEYQYNKYHGYCPNCHDEIIENELKEKEEEEDECNSLK